MTTYIKQLLFEPNNINKETVLEDIKDVMFSKEFINKYKQKTDIIADTVVINNHSIQEPVIVQHKKNNEYKLPKQKNTLFWCMYIAKHGYDEYMQIRNNYGSKQLEIQQDVSKYIREHMYALKNVNTRITKAAGQEILSDLLIETKKTSIQTLYAYLIYYKVNVIILHHSEKSILEVFYEAVSVDIPLFLIKKEKDGNYTIKEEPLTMEEYNNMKSTKFCLHSIDKPMKAISNYKAEELNEVADNICPELLDEKITKVKLYDELKKILSWE